MSHTTTIDSVVFSDVDALQAAVNELAGKGVQCSLLKGGTPRAYFANQTGMGPADYVLRLEQAPYDIGFYHDKAKGGYVARTDLYANHVSKVLGVKKVGNESDAQAALGKLYSTYAAHAVSRQAIRSGRSVRRIDNPDGSIRMVVTGY